MCFGKERDNWVSKEEIKNIAPGKIKRKSEYYCFLTVIAWKINSRKDISEGQSDSRMTAKYGIELEEKNIKNKRRAGWLLYVNVLCRLCCSLCFSGRYRSWVK